MLDKLEKIREEGFQRIAEASDRDVLEAVRKELTGKKSALQEVLKSRGHDVEIIDYRIPINEEAKKEFPWKIIKSIKSPIKRVKYIIKRAILLDRIHKSIRVFDYFLKTRLNLSKERYSSTNFPAGYDYIFFGSDQIWNPRLCKGFDPVFWGAFPKGNSKFVSYAASLGGPEELSDEQWLRVGHLLKNFDKISVREQKLKVCLESKFHIGAECTLDPVLLGGAECFYGIILKPAIEDYIFVYNVQNDKNAIGFAKHLAKGLGCSVVLGRARPDTKYLLQNGFTLAEAIAPEEFLGYIKHAKLVIGNSFHAIALSIVFKKNFYSLHCPKAERVKDLLSRLGLEDRYVSSFEQDLKINEIDYSLVDDQLNALRQSSLRFLSDIDGL